MEVMGKKEGEQERERKYENMKRKMGGRKEEKEREAKE